MFVKLREVIVRVFFELRIENVIIRFRVKENAVCVWTPKFASLTEIALYCAGTLPDDFVSKEVLAENLVEHDFDIMTGVAIAVVVEAAGFLQHTVQLDATRAHKLDVSLR